MKRNRRNRRQETKGDETRIATVVGERGRKPLFPGSERRQFDAQSRVGELELPQVIEDWKFLSGKEWKSI